ncbi:MAG TPA: DUF2130 domain-containing protein [bacterium]|nr:DUF2130 domain-containing protein [bacterium]HPN67322.1 DUF2130 domain-containing protein [bacterium]
MEISEALTKDIQEQILKDVNVQHQNEITSLKNEYQTNLEKTKADIQKQAIEKANKAYEDKIKLTKDEAEEQNKKNQQLQKEMLEITKELRQARDAETKIKIEFERKLIDEQAKITLQAKQEAAEEAKFKLAEKDKKLLDMEKQIEEMKRKVQQGSQQTQGEVLELEFEERLKQQFPWDEIREVPKGIKGADIIQSVKTKSGVGCGTIVWELKNTKNWSPGWVQKLTEDQRALKAEMAILVSIALPDNVKSFAAAGNIWVSDYHSAINLAGVLRQQLLEVHKMSLINKGKETKAEQLYNYLTSNEFKQRIEVWVEYFQNKQIDINKERIYFTKKWEKDEKEIFRMIENTAGMYGEIQGVIGSALPRVDYLELPEETETEAEVNTNELSPDKSNDRQLF